MSDRPMEWSDYTLARKYVTETRIGSRVREAVAAEKAQARANREALRKQERGR